MKQSIQSIQFLRFVAASLVVFVHATEAVEKYFPAKVSSTLAYFSGAGASGVHIFFVISGFVMVYTALADPPLSSKTFFVRRLSRIYPIYFVYSAVYLVFYSIVTNKHPALYQIPAALLLLPGYSSAIIGPGWTLSYEMYFYVCFALVLFLPALSGLLVLTAFFLISIAAGLFTRSQGGVLHVLTNPLLAEFVFGCWIGYLVIAGTKLNSWLAATSILAGLVGFGAGLAFGYSRIPSLIAWGIPSAFLLAGMTFLERNHGPSWLIRRFSFLGDSSYSLYLLHILTIDAVLLSAIRFLDLSRVSALSIVVVLALVCTAVALVLYSLIERRLIREMRAISVGRPSGPGRSGSSREGDASQPRRVARLGP